MNVGIISDIHGDVHALETALDHLDQHHRVDHILCAGDLVGRGSEPDRVVEIIRERAIITVRGNHDEWIHGISAENIAFLKALPLDWRGQLNGVNVFMCHGKPGNNLWGLYQDHISKTLINMMLASLDAAVLVAGHTHMPMYLRVDNGCIVNPGSLYTFKSARVSSHSYGILHLPDMLFSLYDVRTGEQVIAPA